MSYGGLPDKILTNDKAFIGKRTLVTTATYTVVPTDVIILVNRAGAVTINLEAIGTAGQVRMLWIYDISGAASSNNITIEPNSSETISNAANKVINTNYGGLKILNATTEWIDYTGSGILASGDKIINTIVTTGNNVDTTSTSYVALTRFDIRVPFDNAVFANDVSVKCKFKFLGHANGSTGNAQMHFWGTSGADKGVGGELAVSGSGNTHFTSAEFTIPVGTIAISIEGKVSSGTLHAEAAWVDYTTNF